MKEATGLGVIPAWLLKFTLYTPGTFFSYPLKPLFNALEGSSYKRSYAHFRRDHSDNFDLFLHILALAFQLTGNYGLLHQLDILAGTDTIGAAKPSKGALACQAHATSAARTGGVGLMTGLTTAAWAAGLANTPAPTPVKAASFASLAVAYLFRHSTPALTDSMITLQGFIEVYFLRIFPSPGMATPYNSSRFTVSALAPALCLRWALQAVVMRYRGCLKEHKDKINKCVVVGQLALTAAHPNGPLFFGLLGWVLSLLTEQPWMYFYSCAYSASFCQGIAHHVTGETPTLPQLGNIHDEYAHTTFFPNLLWQSVYQSASALAAR